MYVQHSDKVWAEFPELVAGVLAAGPLPPGRSVDGRLAPFMDAARARLGGGTESDLPEVQAWRRAYARMGLKPTQYRSASESLLRRFRKEDALPWITPLVDLGNAVSVTYAIPVAVFDTARVAGGIEVRPATGKETYETFGGETETPAEGEIIFADEEGRAHARRWVNRQSGRSAARDTTTSILVVAEALHPTAAQDVPALLAALSTELTEVWGVTPTTAVLTRTAPRFDF